MLSSKFKTDTLKNLEPYKVMGLLARTKYWVERRLDGEEQFLLRDKQEAGMLNFKGTLFLLIIYLNIHWIHRARK